MKALSYAFLLTLVTFSGLVALEETYLDDSILVCKDCEHYLVCKDCD